jgi:2-polyprenyl-3-methyl-5-hydroxy-6-metoxy-1,4-benzoquinol methylase
MGGINETLPGAPAMPFGAQAGEAADDWIDRMAEAEIVSSQDAINFAAIYYDFAAEDHFWVRGRFNVMLRMAAALGLDPSTPWLGLDIGCGEGVVQRQLAATTAWRADGCELNRVALAKHTATGGRALRYDITDRRAELHERYDFLILFDVIEHIDDTRPFLESAAHHLKPRGYVFINVPAEPWLYSRYDAVLGHYRRYDASLLRRHVTEAGMTIAALRHWGWSMLPLAAARKLLVDRKRETDAIVRAGFNPPSRFAAALLSGALAVESFLPAAPFGTSLFAIARKPG